jgi:hypothetical protein
MVLVAVALLGVPWKLLLAADGSAPPPTLWHLVVAIGAAVLGLVVAIAAIVGPGTTTVIDFERGTFVATTKGSLGFHRRRERRFSEFEAIEVADLFFPTDDTSRHRVLLRTRGGGRPWELRSFSDASKAQALATEISERVRQWLLVNG